MTTNKFSRLLHESGQGLSPGRGLLHLLREQIVAGSARVNAIPWSREALVNPASRLSL